MPELAAMMFWLGMEFQKHSVDEFERWSSADLAKEAGINVMTVNSFENGRDAYASTIKKLQQALEATGRVRFEGDRCVCIETSRPL